MARWRWILTQLTRQLWIRATLIGILGAVAAVLALVVDRFVPWEIPDLIGADAVDDILNIIASSMLAVTTFSLSVMTSAYGAATSNVTPRATKLLMQDRVTQNVLSTFIGSFLFSIVGIVVLKTGAYGDRGRVILFIVTIGVIVLIVVSLLRWIDYLTRFGRVGETTQRVEQAARDAMEARIADPYLGGRPLVALPDDALPVFAREVGYVQHIDIGALSECCKAHGCTVHIASVPGSFAHPGQEVARVRLKNGKTDVEALIDAVRAGFTIADERSFDQDPRFGLAVMSEIASRALSQAINDSGTAIDVIGRLTRLMTLWSDEGDRGVDEVAHPSVYVPPLKDEDLFEDAFMPMARDGAGHIEVQVRLQKSLEALSKRGKETFRTAAREQARLAMVRALATMDNATDRERMTRAAEWIG